MPMGKLAPQFGPDDREKTVVKANELIQQSRFSLSTQQQKIVLYLISKIDYEDEDFKEVEFSVQDFCRVAGIDATSGGNYADLKEQIKAIRDKSIWGLTVDGEETLLAWIEKPYINRNSGTIRIRLDEDMKPFLLQLRENFTRYELINTLLMKSKYSIRLYELVMSIHYDKLKPYSRIFQLEELRRMLDAESYVEYRNLNQRVLKLAVTEINKYTDKTVSYQAIKQGRKTVAVELTVESKDVVERMRTRQAVEDELGPLQLSMWTDEQ